jgi:hypothetical protein
MGFREGEDGSIGIVRGWFLMAYMHVVMWFFDAFLFLSKSENKSNGTSPHFYLPLAMPACLQRYRRLTSSIRIVEERGISRARCEDMMGFHLF